MLSPRNRWRAGLDAAQSERDLGRFLRAHCGMSREQAEAFMHAAKRILQPPTDQPAVIPAPAHANGPQRLLRRLGWRS